MTDRIYPRWVHADGHSSVVAQSADEEEAILNAWAAEDEVAALGTPQFHAADIERAYSDGIEAALSAAKANDVSDAAIEAIRKSLSAEPANELTEPRRRGGWPKGKPRKAA